METIELQNDLREFYIKEERKREMWRRARIAGALLAIAGAAAWLCKIALMH